MESRAQCAWGLAGSAAAKDHVRQADHGVDHDQPWRRLQLVATRAALLQLKLPTAHHQPTLLVLGRRVHEISGHRERLAVEKQQPEGALKVPLMSSRAH